MSLHRDLHLISISPVVAHVDREALSMAEETSAPVIDLSREAKKATRWWRFDDNRVASMADGPASVPDHGSALALKAAAQKLDGVRMLGDGLRCFLDGSVHREAIGMTCTYFVSCTMCLASAVPPFLSRKS